MFSAFDDISERICSECLAAKEDCMPGLRGCAFYADFEDLEKMCKEADNLAASIAERARNYSPYFARLAAENI